MNVRKAHDIWIEQCEAAGATNLRVQITGAGREWLRSQIAGMDAVVRAASQRLRDA